MCPNVLKRKIQRPKRIKHILLSIGGIENKKYLLPFIIDAYRSKKAIFYATDGTYLFLKKHHVHPRLVYTISQTRKSPNISTLLAKNTFHILINIPSGKRKKSGESTDGEIMRKTAIDQGITLITSTDVAEILLSNISGKGKHGKSQPFYNPFKTYKTNYEKGPFGAFANRKIYVQKSKPTYIFLGQKVFLPFGIASGPLLNSNYVKAAFEKGFDLCVYKTVRTTVFPSHPFPNVLSVHLKKDIELLKPHIPVRADTNYHVNKLTITNSFGVPSKDPNIWKADIKKALEYQKEGQVLIVSFMGSVRPGQTQKEFIEDFVIAAKLSKATGAKVLEVNLSCPNIGNTGLVCYNLHTTKIILSRVRRVIGRIPLIVKIGYFQDKEQLEQISSFVNNNADAIAAINTMQTTVLYASSKQRTLPGHNRTKIGVAGASIKWAGLEMVAKLKEIRKAHKYSFTIIGVGGVAKLKDYKEYKEAGADAIMSATGAMWNPYLAQQIKAQI